jgi:hypothetical protein
MELARLKRLYPKQVTLPKHSTVTKRYLRENYAHHQEDVVHIVSNTSMVEPAHTCNPMLLCLPHQLPMHAQHPILLVAKRGTTIMVRLPMVDISSMFRW